MNLSNRRKDEFSQLQTQIAQYKAENQALKIQLAQIQAERNAPRVTPLSQAPSQWEGASRDKIEQLLFLKNLLFVDIERLSVERNQLSTDLEHERSVTVPGLRDEIRRLNSLLDKKNNAAQTHSNNSPIEPSKRRVPSQYLGMFTVTASDGASNNSFNVTNFVQENNSAARTVAHKS